MVPEAVSWHYRNPRGGIREIVPHGTISRESMFKRDEEIFRNMLKYNNKTIVVLDSGMGDHIVFSHVLPDIKNPEVFCCYPDIVPGKSLAEAYQLFGDLDQFNIYRKMAEWNWKDSLENAYRKMYVYHRPVR